MTGNPNTLPLSNHCLYDGHDVDDAREVLSKLFTEIVLDPLDPGKAFRAQVNGVELPRISICHIQFENGAVAGPKAPLDFHTLQLNPTGSVIYNTDDGAAGGDIDQGVMLSAGQTVRNRHSAANGNLALIVKDDVIRNYLARYVGAERPQSLKFAPEFDLTQPRVASLMAFIDTFVQELDRPGGILEAPAAIASFEETLLNFLLFGLEHNFRDQLEIRSSAPGPRYVKELEEYMAAHASDPIDMTVLTRMSGLSGATIHRGFRKYRGYTPMQYLQEERLRLVHLRLLTRSPTESVSKIAMECGFVHMGRFAADYQCRYNEYPSQTIKREKPNGISIKGIGQERSYKKVEETTAQY